MPEDISFSERFQYLPIIVNCLDVEPAIMNRPMLPERVIDVTDMCDNTMQRMSTALICYARQGADVLAQLVERRDVAHIGTKGSTSVTVSTLYPTFAPGIVGEDGILHDGTFDEQAVYMGFGKLEMLAVIMEHLPEEEAIND